MGTKHIGVMTLTFQGHVTSSVTWPFDSEGPISYRHSIVTKSLSPAVSEIMGTKHIGVMTLTFQGHVTSWVTWPFDSQGPVSYRHSLVTKSLSPAVFEILGTKHIGVMTLTFQDHVTSSVKWPLDSGWVISYWWSFGPKSLSLTSKNLQNFDLLGALEIRGYEKCRFLLQKYHPCVNARRLSHFASKSVGGGGSDLQGGAGKKTQKVTRGSHRNDVSPLTQGLRYRAACDSRCLW